MKISPLSNQSSFTGVQRFAAKHYLESKAFKDNETTERKRFMWFLKEQFKNKNYHIVYDKDKQSYTVGVNDGAIGKAGDDFGIFETKKFIMPLLDSQLEAYGLERYSKDIYRMGEVCDKLERVYPPTRLEYAEFFDYVV